MDKEELEEEQEEKMENDSFFKSFYQNNKKLIWVSIFIILLVIVLSLVTNRDNTNNQSIVYIALDDRETDEVKVSRMGTVMLSAIVDGKKESMVTWESSDNSVATVNNGYVKGISKGSTFITITTSDGRKDSCYIVVTDGDPSVQLNSVHFEDQALIMSVGEEENLHLVTSPINGYIEKKAFRSSNPNILTVNENGKVKALKSGVVNVSLSVNSSLFADELTIHVVNERITSKFTSLVNKVLFNNASFDLLTGETKKIDYYYEPSSASNLTILWESNHEENAIIDESGNVTGISEGTAIITAKALNGKELASTIVEVKGGFSVSIPSNLNLNVDEKRNVVVSLNPSTASRSNLSFESGNNNIITVTTADGGKTFNVIGKSVGETIVIVKNNGVEKARMNVKVSQDNQNTNDSQNKSVRGYTPHSSDVNENQFMVNSHDQAVNNVALGPVDIVFNSLNNYGTTSVKVCKYLYGDKACNPDAEGIDVLIGNVYTISEKGDWVIRISEYTNGVKRRDTDNWYLHISDIENNNAKVVTGCYIKKDNSTLKDFKWFENEKLPSNYIKTVILTKDDCENAFKGYVCFKDKQNKYHWGKGYSFGKNNTYIQGIIKEQTCLDKYK